MIDHLTDNERIYARWEKAQQVFGLLKTAKPSERKRLRRLVYRCPNRQHCSILEVYVSAEGVLIYEPPKNFSLEKIREYRSRDMNVPTNADGSALTDSELQQHFEQPSARFLADETEQYYDSLSFYPVCHHIDDVQVFDKDIRDHLNAGHRTIYLDPTAKDRLTFRI